MGRPTGPREDSGDGCPFLRRSPPRPGPLPEDRSYFEEPDITVPVGPVVLDAPHQTRQQAPSQDRKSTRLNSSHGYISYAVFCLKKKKNTRYTPRASTA